MSAVQICTTPKGDLLHYYYIFRMTDPLDIYMKNVACFMLGTMLHLEVKNGKEATKTSNFQKYLGGTATWMKRLMMATKGYGQITSDDT